MEMNYFNVQKIILIRVLIKTYDVMVDGNVQVDMMNMIVIVCVGFGGIDLKTLDLDPSPAGIPIVAIILAVLAFLVLVCLLSTGRLEENQFRLYYFRVNSSDLLLLSCSS